MSPKRRKIYHNQVGEKVRLNVRIPKKSKRKIEHLTRNTEFREWLKERWEGRYADHLLPINYSKSAVIREIIEVGFNKLAGEFAEKKLWEE